MISPYLIEKVGRRPFFLFISLIGCIGWILLALGQWGHSNGIGTAIGLLSMICGYLAFKLGLNTMPTIMINELCPFASKAAVTEVLQIAPLIISMVLAMTYMPIEHKVGPIFNIPFIFVSLTLFFLLYKMLPETNAKKQNLYEKMTNYGAIGDELKPLKFISGFDDEKMHNLL